MLCVNMSRYGDCGSSVVGENSVDQKASVHIH